MRENLKYEDVYIPFQGWTKTLLSTNIYIYYYNFYVIINMP